MPQFDPLIFFDLTLYMLFSFVAVYTCLQYSFYTFIVPVKFIEKVLTLLSNSIEKNWGLILNIFRFKYFKM